MVISTLRVINLQEPLPEHSDYYHATIFNSKDELILPNNITRIISALDSLWPHTPSWNKQKVKENISTFQGPMTFSQHNTSTTKFLMVFSCATHCTVNTH